MSLENWRNTIDYERIGTVSEKEVLEVIELAKGIRGKLGILLSGQAF